MLLSRKESDPTSVDEEHVGRIGAHTVPGIRVCPDHHGAVRCHDGPVSLVWRVVARAVAWPLVPALLVGVALVEAADHDSGPTTMQDVLVGSSYALAVLVPYAVGALAALRSGD